MSKDVELKDTDGNAWSLENLSTQRWLEGQAPGAEAVIAWLNERAVTLFREGQDEAAVFLRDLVPEARREVLSRLKLAAEKHAQDFPIHPPLAEKPEKKAGAR